MMRCNVVNAGCEGQTHCECYKCGLPVCRACSTRGPWDTFVRSGAGSRVVSRVKRICAHCFDEEERFKAERKTRASRDRVLLYAFESRQPMMYYTADLFARHGPPPRRGVLVTEQERAALLRMIRRAK